MYALTKGPYLPSNKGSNQVGFLSDNYGGYLTPQQTKFAKSAGQGLIALEIMAWADQNEIPNYYSFVKDLIGARFGENPDKYKEHYNRMFTTLGNGKLEWNDFLGFPVNFHYKNLANKAANKNPNTKRREEEERKKKEQEEKGDVTLS